MSLLLTDDYVALRHEAMSGRPYQLEGVEFLLSGYQRKILADDMGLGKTLQAIEAAERFTEGHRDVLIVGTKVTVGVWAREIKKWTGVDPVLYIGHPNQRYRKPLRGVRYVVTTYSLLDSLLEARDTWPLIIADECHTYVNRKTQAFRKMRSLTSHGLFELSGSPILNGVQDLWTQLYLIDNKRFGSYWQFCSKYLAVGSNGFGRTIEGVRRPEVLRDDLKPYFLRRRKTKVANDLPPKTRQAIPLQMKPLQAKLYKTILDDDMVLDSEGKLVMTQNTVSMIMRLRQLLVSPAVLGAWPNESAALEALVERVTELMTERQPFVVYTPFTSAFPYIAAALKLAGVKDVDYISGELNAKQQADIVDTFQSSMQTKRAIICSIRAATSFTLTSAAYSFFLGFDWVPKINEQAEDRLYRIGQTQPTFAYYFTHEGTVDEHVLNILSKKTTWSALAIDPDEFFRPKKVMM